MQRASRKPDVADQLLSDSEPLDADEQLAVIRALEGQHMQQNRTFRLSFAVIALLMALFFMHATYEQHIHPFEARYTGELRPVLPNSQSVVAVLFTQCLALLAAAAGLMKELPKRGDRERACMPAGEQVQMLLGAGAALASIGCVYWSAALQRSMAKYGYELGAKWELAWLPALPLGYCLVCWYVVYSINATASDVQRLKHMQYDFKKV